MRTASRKAVALLDRGAAGSRLSRLRSAVPRYLAGAVALVLLAVGLQTLLVPRASAPAPAPPPAADAPSRDFALQFARAYLTFDSRRPELRARALAPFLSGLDADAGFSVASGAQRVDWAEIASDQPALAGGRIITVAAQVSGQRLPVYLAVTVAHDRERGLALLGYPAFVGAPAVAPAATPDSRTDVDDRAVTSVVARALRNYLAGSAPNLEADLTPDAAVTLPTLALRVRGIDRVEWLGGVGSGAVLAAVTAADRRGATYTLSYELGIAYRERPYVDFIAVVPTAG